MKLQQPQQQQQQQGINGDMQHAVISWGGVMPLWCRLARQSSSNCKVLLEK
jgi:hypothetical protein